MSKVIGLFPFGEQVLPVLQTDKREKSVFVLGVYASAVHAKWLDKDGKTLVRALAVASEPSIFWRGEDVDEIIANVEIPEELGRLEPAAPNLNGPSGLALDTHFLMPLGYRREDAWLCDLVPHSCVNEGQSRAIQREYEPLRAQYGLPKPTVPNVPKQLADKARQAAILNELLESKATTLITLGDEPLKWFAALLSGCHKRLKDFGETPDTYGKLHEIQIGDRTLNLLPLVHPRQAGRLGAHSAKWAELHEAWTKNNAPELLS
jgi:uracil-DNA glycosylase